jgi:hypothetical protein
MLGRVLRYLFPDVFAPIGPSDSLVSFSLGSGLPLLSAYLDADVRSAAELMGSACDLRASARAHHAWGLVTGSPFRRVCRGETRVSQVSGSSSSYAPQPSTPPVRFVSRPVSIRCALAFRVAQPLGTPEYSGFEAVSPRLTRLRTYASTTPLPALPQGSLPIQLGSVLIGRVSHPLDDLLEFQAVTAASFPSRPALPGRFVPTTFG